MLFAVPAAANSGLPRPSEPVTSSTGGQGYRSCPPVFLWLLSLSFLLMVTAGTGGESVPGGTDLPEQSWDAPRVEKSLLLAGDRLGKLTVVVGERGHLLRSEDDGATWDQIQVPTRSMLCAVEMIDLERGWAAGHDAVILTTTDGGRSWQLQHRQEEWESPIFDLWFEDASHGIAVGGYGLFLETRDGGSTWNRRFIDEEEPHFYGIVADGHVGDGGAGLLMVGEFGTVLGSSDSGGNWTRYDCPYEGTFFGALCAAPRDWLVFGLRGNLLHSKDRGKSWQVLESQTEASLFASALDEDGTITLVGSEGVFLERKAGVDSFDRFEISGRPLLSDVMLMQDGRRLLLGKGGLQSAEVTPGGGR